MSAPAGCPLQGPVLRPEPARGGRRARIRTHPEIKVGIYRSRLDEIPRQVLDREVDLGFVKDEPIFRELKCVQIHADQMVLIGSPSHPFASRPRLDLHDLPSEHFVLHHQCSATIHRILQFFEQNGSRCKVAAELWSFENVKQFVREEVGFAIVPRICVRQDLMDGARAFIEIEGGFNWEAAATPVRHSRARVTVHPGGRARVRA